MQIKDCGGCGNCEDFECPTGAFKFVAVSTYASARIDKEKCNDCGVCKNQIDCLCEAINDR